MLVTLILFMVLMLMFKMLILKMLMRMMTLVIMMMFIMLRRLVILMKLVILITCFSALKNGSKSVNFNFPVKVFFRTDIQTSFRIIGWD